MASPGCQVRFVRYSERIMTTHLAMWSGPRNLSTALMRSFGSRPDATVSDEPLYAHYLKATGKPHPMTEEILRDQENDWRIVVDELRGPIPGGRTLWYQKHMAHHLLPDMGREWLEGLEHAFLIREPRAVVASLLAKLESVELEDTGLPQQVELFRREAERTGRTPAVVDAADILRDPERTLSSLCARLGLEFTRRMLQWEKGPRDTDGCWGPYWYANTYESTGFGPPRESRAVVPAEYEELALRCEELYAELAEHKITL